MNKYLAFFAALAMVGSVRANWEHGTYGDDGGRFTFSVRGGVAMPFASMANDLGSFNVAYWTDGAYYYTGDSCAGGVCDYIGTVDMGQLGVAKKYDSITWAGGAGIGMVVGGNPQWRMELDWLHIAESEFSASPIFRGMAGTISGTEEFGAGSAYSKVSTDIVSAMAYYDFFDGAAKNVGSATPYIGFGIGYASSAAVLALSDSFGDLSTSLVLDGLGNQVQVGNATIIDFYTSETQTNNFALSAALGLSIAIDGGTFFDLGARASYVPRIKWALNNNAGTDSDKTYKEHAIFSAENVIFAAVYAGLRFEF
ncbi:MAG: hypothetical protein LBB08_00185 [Rickettsiales bacterium]|jgi:hypothetical protein|nr:hypothetical protein [Rickettsiales bacterium]